MMVGVVTFSTMGTCGPQYCGYIVDLLLVKTCFQQIVSRLWPLGLWELLALIIVKLVGLGLVDICGPEEVENLLSSG